MKKMILPALIISLLTLNSVSAAEKAVINNSLKLEINGISFAPREADNSDLRPITYKNSTYLPVRALAEALGTEVNYDNQTKVITINSDIAKMPMETLTEYNSEKIEVSVVEDNKTNIIVNGNNMVVSSLNYNNRMYLPVRVLADALGCTTDYFSETNTVSIVNNKLFFPQLCDVSDNEIIATINTNKGAIKVRLFPDYAPKAVENFITHSKNGYYNGVIFHRVINDFVIQSGDPTGTGAGGESIWGSEFENEVTPMLKHIRGALCMANAGENTNGSQFYIVQNQHLDENLIDEIKGLIENQDKYLDDTQTLISEVYPKELLQEYLNRGGLLYLDYGYTVFGQVLEGMDTVDNIAKVKTNDSDKPIEDVIINSITVEE